MAFCFHGVRKERRVLSPFVFLACAGGGQPPYSPTLPQEEPLMLEYVAVRMEKKADMTVFASGICAVFR